MENKLIDVDVSLNINAYLCQRLTLTKKEYSLLKDYLNNNWDINQYNEGYIPNPLWEILVNKLDYSNISFDVLEYVELENEVEYDE